MVDDALEEHGGRDAGAFGHGIELRLRSALYFVTHVDGIDQRPAGASSRSHEIDLTLAQGLTPGLLVACRLLGDLLALAQGLKSGIMSESSGNGLSHQQGGLVAIETQSTANLLRDGREALRTMTYASRGADTVFTLLALGVEKLLKLSVGLEGLEQSGAWPGKRVRSFGHRIGDLDNEVRGLMRTNFGKAAQRGQVQGALERLDADRLWPLLKDGLDRYGREGRYHYLDWISDEPKFDSPRGYWDSIEREAGKADRELLPLFASLRPGDFETARSRTNAAVVESLTNWWSAIYVFWTQGTFGTVARSMSSDIDPNGLIARLK